MRILPMQSVNSETAFYKGVLCLKTRFTILVCIVLICWVPLTKVVLNQITTD